MNLLLGLIEALFSNFLSFARGRIKFSPYWLLVPFSWIFAVGVAIRNFSYDHGLRINIEPRLPVISVGNLTIGGTNKTPFVEMLCRKMGNKVKVGIVSRGYGGKGRPSPVVFMNGKAERSIVGDEPLLLSSRLPDVPIAVSSDRLDDVNSLSKLGVELVVADDTFQHRKLGRDVDIVLIDAVCPFGNGTLLPSGILREPKSSLKRAHMVVITKSDQVSEYELSALKMNLEKSVEPEKIFTSRIVMDKWRIWDGKTFIVPYSEVTNGDFRNSPVLPSCFVPFCAIGNPDSFYRSLNAEGVSVCNPKVFRDHHRYTVAEMIELEREAKCKGAALVCTEKDIYNMPDKWQPSIPLWVPMVSTVLDEPERFYEKLVKCLRPHIVVASNGYGEDAVGVLLAEKLRQTFPEAEVTAFPLVGKGAAYAQRNFRVYPEPSITPSGGVIKYHLRDLWRDLRSGLLKHISSQMRSWSSLRGHIRTPLCVGDVYLLFHTLYGQGCVPLFMATAKTVYLSGHWRSERFFIKCRSRRTWTRDEETAKELYQSGADAVYEGNPIMDLSAASSTQFNGAMKKHASEILIRNTPTVLLLPGSRERAYEDVKLLLDAAVILNRKIDCRFMMVIAPTLDSKKISASINLMTCPLIEISTSPIARAAELSDIVIGLGGTANQVCAGYGVPVVSIEEKGKFVQKKLLGDSEILVPPTPEALAYAAFKIIDNKELHSHMANVGRQRMGGAGAIDGMIGYAKTELGWELRCKVWRELKS